MPLIIFDVDATLVYSNKLDSKAFAQIYEDTYGLPFPSIDWSTYPHVTDDTILKTVIEQHFQRAVTEKERSQFKASFLAKIIKNRTLRPTEYKIVPGAKKLLELLIKDSDYTVGIATGGWKAPAVMKLDFVNIPTTPLIISGADGKTTRHEIIEEVLANANKIQASFDRVIYVGDAIWDVKTTRDMQIPLIGVRLKGDVEVLKKEGVRHVVKNYLDIPTFMQYVKEAVPPI